MPLQPSLQPTSSAPKRKPITDVQNARSRFLKSKSTNALLEQNGKNLKLGNAALLERAALVDGKVVAVTRQQQDDKHVQDDVVHTKALLDSAGTPPAVAMVPERGDEKLAHKIPSFSEVVEVPVPSGIYACVVGMR